MSYSPDSPSKNSLPRCCYKILLLILFIGTSFIWMMEYISKNTKENLFINQFSNHIITDRKLFRNSSKKMKYMLLWTPASYAPFYYFESESEAFIRFKCPTSNCYITSNRDFFGDNVTKFDAIAFNGRNIATSDLPKERSLHQKYIYFNMESSENYPVCDPIFDGFFNWTSTYKLNSDIVLPYLSIRNKAGEEVGPRSNVTWENIDDNEAMLKYKSKSKAAAWMVSNCNTRSKRQQYVELLKTALEPYHQTVDIYGACGPLKCPRYRSQCDIILQDKYYFYLSFENSISEDYVTEKLYTALKNNVVPVVLGGANYSRFLPPGSYLNAMEYSPEKLAAVMVDLMNNPDAYNKFFGWRSYYTYYKSRPKDAVCRVCAALNNKTLLETHTAYENFRGWWNPNYEERCKENS